MRETKAETAHETKAATIVVDRETARMLLWMATSLVGYAKASLYSGAGCDNADYVLKRFDKTFPGVES